MDSILERLVIVEVTDDKERLMPLLLIGDESEAMIARYLDACRVYEGVVASETVAVCAVQCVAGGEEAEIKNLAVVPHMQHVGIGTAMLRHVERLYVGKRIILGTGETLSTLRFYKSRGYAVSHIVSDFFTDNYPHPIIEEGVRLKDMIYLYKQL